MVNQLTDGQLTDQLTNGQPIDQWSTDQWSTDWLTDQPTNRLTVNWLTNWPTDTATNRVKGRRQQWHKQLTVPQWRHHSRVSHHQLTLSLNHWHTRTHTSLLTRWRHQGTHRIIALLLIYLPQKDERLSWPSWLTCSGRFTHIVVTRGYRPSIGQGQFAGQRQVKSQTLVPSVWQPTHSALNLLFLSCVTGVWVCTHDHCMLVERFVLTEIKTIIIIIRTKCHWMPPPQY